MAAMETDEVSLPQALAAVQESFADAPGDAQAARQWAEGRGYDWGDSEQLLAQFLQGEARCETLRKAREHKKGEAQRAGVQARANALAAELGGEVDWQFGEGGCMAQLHVPLGDP